MHVHYTFRVFYETDLKSFFINMKKDFKSDSVYKVALEYTFTDSLRRFYLQTFSTFYFILKKSGRNIFAEILFTVS